MSHVELDIVGPSVVEWVAAGYGCTATLIDGRMRYRISGAREQLEELLKDGDYRDAVIHD